MTVDYRRIGTIGVLFGLMFLGACGQPGEGPAAAAGGAPPPARSVAVEAADPGRSGRTIRNITTDTLAYGEVNEQLVYGYFAFPEDMVDPLPAVIVIHDWWGLNDEIRNVANRLSAEGYIVLAIDLFGGATADNTAAARDLERGVVDSPELADLNVGQAYRFVREVAGAPRVGILGFGFGGGLALNAAIARPKEFAAIVSYYGQVNADQDALDPVSGPILGLFAEGDRAVPPETVRAFERALEALDKDYQVIVYDNARRGFADRQMGDSYDPAIEQQAWLRTVEFLQRSMAITEPR